MQATGPVTCPLKLGMDMSTPATIDQLQTLIRGRLITPGDPEYDALRRVTAAVDRRPAVIARVADAGDIGAMIGFAREAVLPLAVRSGGHSSAGHGVVEGGVVIDMRDMRDLEIDVAGRTAWAETGLTAGEYTMAIDAHGLATGSGTRGRWASAASRWAAASATSSEPMA